MRQDRLTLQLLSVMDRLWKEEEGLDLRLNVYNCLSTGVNEGLIEVVTLAETVCRIQMKQADAFVLKVSLPILTFNKVIYVVIVQTECVLLSTQKKGISKEEPSYFK